MGFWSVGSARYENLARGFPCHLLLLFGCSLRLFLESKFNEAEATNVTIITYDSVGFSSKISNSATGHRTAHFFLFTFGLHGKSMDMHIWHRSYTYMRITSVRRMLRAGLNVPCDAQSPIWSSAQAEWQQQQQQQHQPHNKRAEEMAMHHRYILNAARCIHSHLFSSRLQLQPQCAAARCVWCARFRSGTFLFIFTLHSLQHI